MIACNRFRVEVCYCQDGSYRVSIQPVEYMAKEEFRAWVRLCKRNFMVLVSRRPWVFENSFADYGDAVLFARGLCRELGELAFFDRTKAQMQFVAPKEEEWR